MNGKSDALKQQLKDAMNHPGEAIERDHRDDIVIDATIKRFELAYELSWKYLKQQLEAEGILSNSLRQCFKQALAEGWISDETGWLEMIEDRNLLVHTYSHVTSRNIYDRIANNYFNLLNELTAKP